MAKMWMMQNGVAFYESKITVYGTQGYREAVLLRYLRRLHRFLQPEDTRPEQEKDIWRLDRLGIPIEENPIYKTETLNFTKITQEGIREEVKRAIYLKLKIETLGTVQGELTSLRRFSKYLRESKHEIQSCSEIDRELLEEYLVHISTDGSSGKSNSNSVLNLRKVLETVGKIFDYEHLERLFINTEHSAGGTAEIHSILRLGTEKGECTYHKAGCTDYPMPGHPPNARNKNIRHADIEKGLLETAERLGHHTD